MMSVISMFQEIEMENSSRKSSKNIRTPLRRTWKKKSYGRMVKHADYYKKESAICSTYNFIKKIVDFLYEICMRKRILIE